MYYKNISDNYDLGAPVFIEDYQELEPDEIFELSTSGAICQYDYQYELIEVVAVLVIHPKY